jgi:hypothetical protein
VLAVKDERAALAAFGGLRSLTAVRAVIARERAIPPQFTWSTDMTQSDNLPKGTEATADPNPTSSFSLERYYRERLENVRQRLPEAQSQLKEAGVEWAYITYDGCGDSGQIESIEYTDRDGEPIDPVGKITMTVDQLLDLFYDLTQVRHPGWENNDGACGEFEWDLMDDTLKHTHNDRFTDYDTTEHEGL